MHLDNHPMFERIPDEDLQDDPCISAMRGETDEAHKVIKKEGDIFHAVFRKKDIQNDGEEKEGVENDVLEHFM